MRDSLDARAQRLIRRLPRTTVFSALELLLLSLLAIQCARLMWVMITPVGPIGDWRGDAGVAALAAPDASLFGQFDPFFRLEGGSAIVVTELDLQLFGVRQDRATGRGSAIIAQQNGEQTNYLVGEEIMPGVILKSVGFDYVTIERGGAEEQIFLDQSGGTPTPSASRPAAAQSPPGIIVPAAQRAAANRGTASQDNTVSPRQLASGTQISPRREGNRLTGIILQPTGDGAALAAAGFEPGDVILSINGERIQDMGQAARFSTMLGDGNALVQVERNGETTSFRARVHE